MWEWGKLILNGSKFNILTAQSKIEYNARIIRVIEESGEGFKLKMRYFEYEIINGREEFTHR